MTPWSALTAKSEPQDPKGQAIRNCGGIDLGRERAPDAATLRAFRRLLEDKQLTAHIFPTINQHHAVRGLLLREGGRGGRDDHRFALLDEEPRG